jgi:hypothetical protein
MFLIVDKHINLLQNQICNVLKHRPQIEILKIPFCLSIKGKVI